MTASHADRTTTSMPRTGSPIAMPAPGNAGRPLSLHVVRDLRDAPPVPVDGEVPRFDVVVAPGGLTRSAATTVEALRDAFPLPMPIVCVLGNEEFRGQDRKRAIEAARRSAHCLSVTLLEDSAEVVMGVRFVGATFWTDFRLHGSHVDTMERAFGAAEEGIGYARHMRSDGRPFDPYAAVWAHSWSRVWMTRELAVPFDCQSAFKVDPLSAFNIDPLAAICGGGGRPAKRVRVAQPGGCGGVMLRPRRGS